MFKERFRFIQMRKEFLFRLEFRRMHASAAAAKLHGMLEVEHLVIDDVLHCVARNPGVVEDTAHDDGVVGRIVMA